MSQEVIRSTVVPVIYLLSTVLFIFGIKQLAKVKTASPSSARCSS
jgi:NAD/NADP transhydrogenase beta subunit